jgi:hypothetical protein
MFQQTACTPKNWLSYQNQLSIFLKIKVKAHFQFQGGHFEKSPF